MLGHEVVYDSTAGDNSLLAQASGGEMILLTADKELYQRAHAMNLAALLVSGNREEERLAELAANFKIPLSIDMARTRCPECGAGLRGVSKKDVESLVPPKSLKLYEEFWKCENTQCGKVYWMGSHWKQINRTLTEARRLYDQKERGSC
jgi:uncharacterized protein